MHVNSIGILKLVHMTCYNKPYGVFKCVNELDRCMVLVYVGVVQHWDWEQSGECGYNTGLNCTKRQLQIHYLIILLLTTFLVETSIRAMSVKCLACCLISPFHNNELFIGVEIRLISDDCCLYGKAGTGKRLHAWSSQPSPVALQVIFHPTKTFICRA